MSNIFLILFSLSHLSANHIPNEILINWKNLPSTQQYPIAGTIGSLTKLKDLDLGWQLWGFSDDVTIEQTLEALRKDPAVKEVQPNFIRHSFGRVPNDPLIANQKHLDLIRAYAAWDFDTGGSTPTTIAVIDTGVDTTHTDLTQNIWTSPLDTSANGSDEDKSGFDGDIKGRNFADNTNDASDIIGHGTLVAGVAGARGNNAIGVSGVIWQTKILPIQIFRTVGCIPAPPCADDATLAGALNYAVRLSTVNELKSYTGRLVINLSLGGDTTSQILLDAVNNALNTNVVVVAAKGNNGNSGAIYPSDYPGVIGVGGTANNDTLAYFSNFGSGTDITAPGVDVFATKNGGGYMDGDGTSFSSPQVAAAIALIYNMLPTATTSQAEQILLGSVDDLGSSGRDDYFGYGRLNLLKLMRRARFGTLADFEGLSQAIAVPNPYRVGTGSLVTFSVPSAIVGTNAKVELYDVSGLLIRELLGFSWDGKNEKGFSVASGIYVFRVKTDTGSSHGRVIVEGSIP